MPPGTSRTPLLKTPFANTTFVLPLRIHDFLTYIEPAYLKQLRNGLSLKEEDVASEKQASDQKMVPSRSGRQRFSSGPTFVLPHPHSYVWNQQNGLEFLKMELAARGEVSSLSSDTNKNGQNDHWLGPFNSFSHIYQMPLCQGQADKGKPKEE